MNNEKETVLDDFGSPNQNRKDRNKPFRRLERIFTVLFFLGYLFKWFHLKGSDILIILSLGSLAILYVSVLFWTNKAQYTKHFSLLIRFISGLFLSVAMVGLLFRIMFWTGGQEMITAGPVTLLFGLTIITIPKFFYVDSAWKRGALRYIFWGGLTTFYLILPMRIQVMWKYLYGDHPLKESYTDFYNNPDDLDKLENYKRQKKHYYDSVRRARNK